MTLLVSLVSGNAIIMGADSAMVESAPGPRGTIALHGFDKVLGINRYGGFGISIAGAAWVGEQRTWVNDWINQFAMDVAQANNFLEFAQELADTLSTESVAEETHTLQLGAWCTFSDSDSTSHSYKAPVLLVINKDEGSAKFSVSSPIDKELLKELAEWKDNDAKGFPYTLVVKGQPHDYRMWLENYGFPAYERLLGEQLVTSRVDSQELLVRFLIRNVSDLYKMSGRVPVVSEPIQTLVLFRDRAWAVRMPG